MIYRNSYFSKELRQAYLENNVGMRRKLSFALFMGVLSFAIHFILRTLTESILSDLVPYLIQESYFSTIYLYNGISILLYAFYFMIQYDFLSFAELRKNQWYVLVKMGYKPKRMILSKLGASIYSIAAIYAIGFFAIILMTAVLKYRFVYSYLPALFLAGLIDMFLLTMAAMTISLYTKNKRTARYLIFISGIAIVVLHFLLGYHEIVSNRVLMQNLLNLFDFHTSLYLPVAGGLILLCLIVCVWKAKSVAQYYSVPDDIYRQFLSEDQKVVVMDSLAGKLRPLYEKKGSGTRAKALDAVITACLVLMICAVMVCNVFIIVLSAARPGEELTFMGYIPYVFKSSTMEPAIMENDLALFKRIDISEPVAIGDIVLFQDKSVVFVERVISKEEDRYVVDIDRYPLLAREGEMLKTIDRSAIYGIYSDSNRWLGAFILFTNTILGRIVFLVGPILLLFFYKPVKTLFLKNKKLDMV